MILYGSVLAVYVAAVWHGLCAVHSLQHNAKQTQNLYSYTLQQNAGNDYADEPQAGLRARGARTSMSSGSGCCTRRLSRCSRMRGVAMQPEKS